MLVLAALTVAVIAIAAVAGKNDEGGGGGGSGTVSEPYTPDLAGIQLGYRPDADNATLKRLASQLDIMEADCPSNTRRNFADYTANVLLQLEDSGIKAKPTEILGDVMQSADLGTTSDCLDLFAAYVILRRHEPEP